MEQQQYQQQQQQEQTILRAIAVSSSQKASLTSAHDRQAAYQILQDLKSYQGRISICLNWLQSEHPIQVHLTTAPNASTQAQDITVATKLLALEILQSFLLKGYSQSSDQDRLTIRQGVLNTCRLLVLQATHLQNQHSFNFSNTSCSNELATLQAGIRILAKKLAVLLEGLIVRDFPQRWTTLASDLFSPLSKENCGGLWEEIAEYNASNEPSSTASLVGVRICLEALRLVAEDCTDSDFNAKISTIRRNDVLLGLNEIADSVFLPLIFQLLERAYPALQKAKAALHNMNLYLIAENRTVHQMTPTELHQYRIEERSMKNFSLLLYDILRTLEIFCANLPSTWMIGSNTKSENGGKRSLDFVAAFLHLLRVPDANVQVKAIECIDQLSIRGKLDVDQWMRLLQDIPKAFNEANQVMNTVEQEYRNALTRVNDEADDSEASRSQNLLATQLDFHKALSRTVSCVISSHVSHITSDKYILSGKGPKYSTVHAFLTVMVSMLRHPSGRIISEQINVWTTLFRDPQISKKHTLLQPLTEELLTCFIDHMVRIRWDDVENETHPYTALMEASFDDQEDYDEWMNDFRSRSNLLFKFIGNHEPAIAAKVLNDRVQTLISKYGSGEPYDHLNSSNKQLTEKSDAVVHLEAFSQPLDNILGGMPSWAVSAEAISSLNQRRQYNAGLDENDRQNQEIQANVRASLSAMAKTLVEWKPTYVWLKFRHVTLMESLKHLWEYDPTTLLQGVDTVLQYLGMRDEWKNAKANESFMLENNETLSGEIVSLKKRSGTALVSISKRVPHHLVPWLTQLSEATKTLLASDAGLIPMNQMHLYEFLSCVATAVSNPVDRSNFIAAVLSDAVATIESNEVKDAFSSTNALFAALGILQAADHPESVTDPLNVRRVTSFYNRMFTALNRMLSVGKRCNEAARKRSVLGGVSFDNLPPNSCDFGGPGQPMFPPDEGPLSISELTVNDPFTPLWPRILPSFLQIYEVTLSAWRPENQAMLMPNSLQRYCYAISDDEAYLSKNQNTKGTGGVFGEGGTAGSVVAGTDRRDVNLVPKWSGWFNELRNTCFQMFGLLIMQRVLFAPEIAPLYPRIVSVLIDPMNMKSMEHRHLIQFLKHIFEFLLLCCPYPLYRTHLEPIVGPIFEHMRYRLDKTWTPIIGNGGIIDKNSIAASKALTSADCASISVILARGEEEWFSWYYAHAGLFVGDLDSITAEAAVDKHRVDISRTLSDIIQAALALKGDWALALANFAKEEQATKRNDSAKLTSVPRTHVNNDEVVVNADGTPKMPHQAAIDARKLLRISGLSHFLILESEIVAGSLTVTVIQCLSYPDAYTCRRVTKICHRILETAAWVPTYSHLLGNQMFFQAVKNLITEPKWMVGIEWDMINVVRDIYCRFVLGQILLAGGQGPGLQQPTVGEYKDRYEQAKTVHQPLQGGGILEVATDYPRQILASLPGIGINAVEAFEIQMKTKRSAKDQKDCIRDLLRIASDTLNEMNTNNNTNLLLLSSTTALTLNSTTSTTTNTTTGTTDGTAASGSIFDRAVEEESLLHAARRQVQVEPLPEKLVTITQLTKAAARKKQLKEDNNSGGLVELSL